MRTIIFASLCNLIHATNTCVRVCYLFGRTSYMCIAWRRRELFIVSSRVVMDSCKRNQNDPLSRPDNDSISFLSQHLYIMK